MYRVVRGPFYSPSQAALAPRYADVTDAVRAMGEGMVIAEGGRLVAFHESHLETLERLS